MSELSPVFKSAVKKGVELTESSAFQFFLLKIELYPWEDGLVAMVSLHQRFKRIFEEQLYQLIRILWWSNSDSSKNTRSAPKGQIALESTDPGASNVRIEHFGVDAVIFEVEGCHIRSYLARITAKMPNYTATPPIQNSLDRLQSVGLASLPHHFMRQDRGFRGNRQKRRLASPKIFLF